MPLRTSAEAIASLNTLQECGLLATHEAEVFNRLCQPESPFAGAINLAETLHLHIKVDDTDRLPIDRFLQSGAQLDHEQPGFVKYRFPGAINAIFSHIKVSQDEMIETDANRRPRPFLDHIGIDMRDENATVREAFETLPRAASVLDWSVASQGGPDAPVYCCHVEVAEKHWLYPSNENEHPGIPLEFAYGALKINPDKIGCDLRPADPSRVDAASIPCCGANNQTPTSPLCGEE